MKSLAWGTSDCTTHGAPFLAQVDFRIGLTCDTRVQEWTSLEGSERGTGYWSHPSRTAWWKQRRYSRVPGGPAARSASRGVGWNLTPSLEGGLTTSGCSIPRAWKCTLESSQPQLLRDNSASRPRLPIPITASESCRERAIGTTGTRAEGNPSQLLDQYLAFDSNTLVRTLELSLPRLSSSSVPSFSFTHCTCSYTTVPPGSIGVVRAYNLLK